MSTPYIDALKMLGRRELSTVQVRQRLARKGYSEEEVDEAVERLTRERALDDRRVADAIARTAVTIKRRGRGRILREIEQAGISSSIAKDAVTEVFGEVDDDALLQAALGRRLRGDRPIADRREFERLFRYLTAQGFESGRILKALNARRGPSASAPEDLD